MGSWLASMAACPPSYSAMRALASPSVLPCTARFASVSGESLPNTWRTTGSSGPSHSRMRSRPKDSRSASNSA